MEGQPRPQYHLLIRDLPASERPRERLRDHGAAYLSNSELIAILLRTGTPAENVVDLASRLLSRFGGLEGLSRASFQELSSVHGIGEAKTAQLKAALELGRRLLATTGEDRVTIRSPRDVANLLAAEMGLLDQEHFRVLLLNTKNQVMGVREVYKGNVSSAVIRASEVFQEAVRSNCPAIILVHNHPSGDPTPSPEDAQTTRQLVEAGKILDIEVLDHVVIGRAASGGFVSLKERGVGFG
ncbi:MAG: DNA repair protein RadC [Dehalococcoidia bacterium]|nr:DNA repair protein RadC [Dehalococcoidia bacterium]